MNFFQQSKHLVEKLQVKGTNFDGDFTGLASCYQQKQL